MAKGKKNKSKREAIGDQIDDLLNKGEAEDDTDEDEGGDDLSGMTKAQLLAFVKERDLTIEKPSSLKKAELLEAIEAALEGGDEEEEEEEEEEEDGDDTYTEADLKKLTKAKLVDLIEEEELEIEDASKLKKADLIEAILEAMSNEGEELTYAEVMAMDSDELDEVCNDNDIDRPKKKVRKDEDKYRAYVVEELELEEDEEEEEEEEEGEDLTYEAVMGMSIEELDEICEDNDISPPKKATRKVKKYRAWVVEELELEDDEEEEEEEEDEAPAKKPTRTRQSVVSVAAEYPRTGKKKLSREIPFKAGSKRYNAAKVMMEEPRSAEDHQTRAGKTHKKNKTTGNKEYKTVIDANFMRIIAAANGVFEADEEEDTFQLLGFMAAKGKKDK